MRRSVATFLLVGGLVLFIGLGQADREDYNRVKNILVEDKALSVLHHHDWSFDSERRSKIMQSWMGPFRPENVYAYIECVDQFSGRILFRKPSPPLTYLWISNDSNYIVGLSEIRFDNLVQLVVFDRKGRLVKQRGIGAREYELTKSEYDGFVRQFPAAAASLLSRDGIVLFQGKVFINPTSLGVLGYSNEAWDYLAHKSAPSHFSANFSESTSNWVYWYKRDDPGLQLTYKGKVLVGISLLDPKGQRFEIPISEELGR